MLLITGAAGNAGRLLVEAVRRTGQPVRALVRDAAKADTLRQLPGVEVVTADMALPQTLGAALQGVDTAILNSSADPRMAETQCTFVDAARAAGVERVIKLSGQESGIGFDPNAFRFARMHVQIEAHIERSGLRWTHLCPSQFMQVYLRDAPVIAQRGVLALPAGDIELAPVAIEDVADIAAGVLADEKADGQRFVITGPQALGMAHIARLIGAAIGREVVYRPVSVEERSERMRAAGAPAFMVDALAEQAQERLRHPRTNVDVSVQERYGVRPTTFAEFARRNRAVFAGE
ncbi:MAG TPA: NmrA family NAD(P)-binding protein [Ramlibacter sp.]|uniref:NmrA family NAD(P)-binding protein n=1 Tax=Ramlibacter sp. TaxID=1917967 RepID=UPI002B97CE1A|nr:NmrA family NAD(P)-binding protein [Ramlibacter sp.]HVZ46926.1 NmrA family NAD(P)-binding protein [Ramlibacter sp.]